MKPSLQQEETLRTYLNGFLKYHETVDEIYDHILTALKEKADNLSFQDAVNDILNDDFGGGNGLVKMEKQHLKDATWEGFVNIAKYIKADLKFPNIIFTIILFGTLFYTISHIHLTPEKFILIYPVLITFFIGFMWVRKFFVGYYTGNTKSSIADVIITKITSPFLWFNIILMSSLTYKSKLYVFLIIENPQLFSGISTLYILYISALIKICRDEFKPYSTK